MASEDDDDDQPTIRVADISIAYADPLHESGPNNAVWCPLSQFPDRMVRLSRAVSEVYVIVRIGQVYHHTRVDIKYSKVPRGVRW
jgi:hypothetical protein